MYMRLIRYTLVVNPKLYQCNVNEVLATLHLQNREQMKRNLCFDFDDGWSTEMTELGLKPSGIEKYLS